MIKLIKFELLKIYRKKFFLIFFTSILTFSYLSISKSEPAILSFTHEEYAMNPYAIEHNYLSIYKNQSLIDGGFDLYVSLSKDLYEFQRLDERIRSTSEESVEYKELQLERAIKRKDLLKKYNINLSEDYRESIDYEIIKNEYLLKYNNPEYPLERLASRVYFFGTEILLGLGPLILLLFVLSDILSTEYESGTINNLYLLPNNKKKIIYSKATAMLICIITYALFSILALSLYLLLKGESFDILGYYFRLIGDEIKLIPLWKYLLYSIVSFICVTFTFSSLMLMISSVVRSKDKTVLILLIIIITLYISKLSGFFDNFLNPLFQLDYIKSIIGKFKPVANQSLETAGLNYKISRVGYEKFIVPLVLIGSSLAYSLFNFCKEDSKKDKTSSKDSNLFFEVRKILNSYNPIFIISIVFIFIIGLQVSLELKHKKNIEDRFDIYSEINTYEALLESQKQNIDFYPKFYVKARQELKENEDKILLIEEDWLRQDFNLLKEHVDYYFEDPDHMNDPKYTKELESKKSIFVTEKEAYESEDVEIFNSNLKALYLERLPQDYESPNQEFFNKEPKNFSEFSKKVSASRIDIINDKKFDPILGQEVLISKYDKPINEFVKEDLSNRYSVINNQGFYSIFKANEQFSFSLIIFAFVYIVLSGGYTIDKENNKGLVFMYTQPYDRQKWQDKKYASFIIMTVISVLLIVGALFLVSSIINGFGRYDYPILHYDRYLENIYTKGESFEDGYHFISVLNYNFRFIGGLIAGLIFTLSLSNLISIFVGKKSQVILITLAIVLSGYLLTTYIPIDILQSFSPFAYLRSDWLADGSVKLLFENSGMTYIRAITSLAFFTLVNYLLESYFIKRQKINY